LRICMKAQPNNTKKAIPYRTANISISTTLQMLSRQIKHCGSVYPWSAVLPSKGLIWLLLGLS